MTDPYKAVESLDRRAHRAQTLEDNGGHTGRWAK